MKVFFFLRFYSFIPRQRGREGEKGEKCQCVVASHVPCTGDLAHNPGMRPGWELNPRPFGFQASAQSTEPHQPGQGNFLLKHKKAAARLVNITPSAVF